MSSQELHDLIRQLRVELEWAVRTGIEPPPPPPPPSMAATEVARRGGANQDPDSSAADQEVAIRAPRTDAGPRSEEPAAPAPSPHPSRPHPNRPHPNRLPDREGQWGTASGFPDAASSSRSTDVAGSPRSAAVEAAPSARPSPRRSAPPHRPWEAYLPDSQPPLQNQLDSALSLEQVQAILGPCVRCKLHRLGRKNIVFGVGPADAQVMFVGEGPGADEDRVGEPFVGKAGQLLTRIIEAGMGMKRAEVYIANIVKCRPPGNRNPEPDEVEQCEPFLKAQIRVIRPRVLIALGKYAAQTLLRDSTPITRLRGRWREYEGIPLMPTFHPAYLLRNPAEKRPVWEDIQNVLKFLGLPIPGRN